MRKLFLTISLSLAFTVSGFAGEIPIAGVVGCAPGLWYPESEVCVMGLADPGQTDMEKPSFADTLLAEATLYFHPMFKIIF